MAIQRHIKQFRYLEADASTETPTFSNVTGLTDLNEKLKKYSNITIVGIQGPPSTTFILNNTNNELVVGRTGIYEIDVSNYGYISSIEIKKIIDDTPIPLIIDIVYEGGI